MSGARLRARDSITVTMTTTGGSGSLGGLSGGYRWRGIPGWTPGDPRFREVPSRRDVPLVTSDERAKRVAEFCRWRDEGFNIAEAGEMAGVTRKTAGTYERERRAALRQQQGETP